MPSRVPLLQNKSNNLHRPLEGKTHLANGLSSCIPYSEGGKCSYLPCRRSNTNGVLNGKAIDFALENIMEKENS
jgi:hypothetical protein